MIQIVSDRDELKKPSVDVNSSEEENQIAQKLIKALSQNENGLALAGPQIGIYKNVFVTRTTNGWNYFVNPKIEKLENPFIFKGEGCLSFPNVFINTIRYNHAIFSHKYGSCKVSNIGAIVAQHEIGHLRGELFFDFKIPEKYHTCFCGSGKKFKFCCINKL